MTYRMFLPSALFVALLFAAFAAPASAQDVVPAPEARPSPMAVAHTMLDDGTYVKIVYNSPRKRGREVFGKLVPHGKIWRLGANEATEITTTGDITVAGKTLEAGTYSVFAVPNEKTWTLVFNSGLGQWGAYSYDEKQDVLRVDVPVKQSPKAYEAFTMAFEEDSHDLQIMWDQAHVTVPIAAK